MFARNYCGQRKSTIFTSTVCDDGNVQLCAGLSCERVDLRGKVTPAGLWIDENITLCWEVQDIIKLMGSVTKVRRMPSLVLAKKVKLWSIQLEQIQPNYETFHLYRLQNRVQKSKPMDADKHRHLKKKLQVFTWVQNEAEDFLRSATALTTRAVWQMCAISRQLQPREDPYNMACLRWHLKALWSSRSTIENKHS